MTTGRINQVATGDKRLGQDQLVPLRRPLVRSATAVSPPRHLAAYRRRRSPCYSLSGSGVRLNSPRAARLPLYGHRLPSPRLCPRSVAGSHSAWRGADGHHCDICVRRRRPARGRTRLSGPARLLYKSGSIGPLSAARDQNMGRTPFHAPEPKRQATRRSTRHLFDAVPRSSYGRCLAVKTLSRRGCPQAGSATCWPLST
jgi:hypothetical protein